MISTGCRPNLKKKDKYYCKHDFNCRDLYFRKNVKNITSLPVSQIQGIQRLTPPTERTLQYGLSISIHTPDTTVEEKVVTLQSIKVQLYKELSSYWYFM